MKVAAVLRQVPDVVEELVIGADGRSLSEADLMYVTNEADEHALEQALILKGRDGAHVVAIRSGGDEARAALASAVAKGADEAYFAPVPFASRADNHHLAATLASVMKGAGYDLILTGVWASDQLDAGLGGLLAAELGLPYVGGLTSVSAPAESARATVRKEFPGGRLGVMEVDLPAVLGIQSAENPPRYVPVSKVMQAKRSLQAQTIPPAASHEARVHLRKLTKPEAATRAEMISGSPEEVADRLVRILRERGVA